MKMHASRRKIQRSHEQRKAARERERQREIERERNKERKTKGQKETKRESRRERERETHIHTHRETLQNKKTRASKSSPHPYCRTTPCLASLLACKPFQCSCPFPAPGCLQVFRTRMAALQVVAGFVNGSCLKTVLGPVCSLDHPPFLCVSTSISTSWINPS